MLPFTKEALIKDLLQAYEAFQELEEVSFNVYSTACKQFKEWSENSSDYFGKDMLIKAFEEEGLDGLDLHRWAWPQEPAEWMESVNDYISLEYRKEDLHRWECQISLKIKALEDLGY